MPRQSSSVTATLVMRGLNYSGLSKPPSLNYEIWRKRGWPSWASLRTWSLTDDTGWPVGQGTSCRLPSLRNLWPVQGDRGRTKETMVRFHSSAAKYIYTVYHYTLVKQEKPRK
ncbi:hypothetical protein GBAR_LOCUS7918 [Geodia barretti]|uniref:Uncharacterized protein n=1 Tax=Geodia barretti TaxID=519541 RepID=A0AA35RJL7_GEOBA|nr:hypothetical protein GBAR_LOCUS7918 [Geodia barretti]